MKTLSAIDIGYNAVKGLASNGRQTHFPSEVGTVRRATFSLEEVKQSHLVITSRDDSTWHVGQTALTRSDYSAGRRDPEWIFTEPYKVLLHAALSELHKGTTSTSLVTGLPLEHYTALAERARTVFLGEHTFRRNGGRWQTVTIEDVFIVTQPYGSLLDLAMNDVGKFLDNPFSTGLVGIGDLGGMTFNLLAADALDEEARWTQGDNLGLLKAMDAIARDIRADCPGFTPKTREVAEWLPQGQFNYRGRDVDIAPYANPHLEPLAQVVLARMAEVWPEPGRYAAVLLTGGGAAILGPMLKRRMNGVYANVTIASDPVFANVRGYLKLARRLWGS
jgi:plasmid segregation protein ParM